MANPLYQMLGGGQMPGPVGNMQQIMQQYQQFRQAFRGDPKAEVERLVREGKVSQQQLDQCQQLAQQLAGILK